MKKSFLVLLGSISILYGSVNCEEIVVTTEMGEYLRFDVQPNSTLAEVEKQLEKSLGAPIKSKTFIFDTEDQIVGADIYDDWEMKRHGQYLGYPRSYYDPLTPAEVNDIRYIVVTLANRSLVTIAMHRTSLEQAGERIDHVHPLRFLLLVFGDEELKIGMRNIRSRGWIWGDFVAGLKHSLVSESAIENIKDEYIIDLANQLGIDANIIYPAVQKKDWEELIELLIVHVPRKGNSGRYDN